MNTPVKFPTAKLLKEKGFEQRTKSYNEDGKLVTVSLTIRRFNPEKIYYPSPTIAEVVMWLYEKKGIWICIDKAEGFNWFKFNIRKLRDIGYEYGGFGSDYKSPTEAYETAIDYVLNNLI